MADSPTSAQQTYLAGLRAGDPKKSGLIIKSPVKSITTLAGGQGSPPAATSLTDQLRKDFTNFHNFLVANGCPDPQPEDLYLKVEKSNVVALLKYMGSKDCLILQNCFGFDKAINQGGRVQLIHKGNFWQHEGITDSTIFDSVYKKTEKAGDTITEDFELYLNLNRSNQLSVDSGRTYLQNFRDCYGGATPGSFTLGYLLPVRALLTLLQNKSGEFKTADRLTVKWGLTAYSYATMGDFTLVIGTGDLSTGTLLVFRKGGIEGADSTNEYTAPVPCPPSNGCAI